MTWFRPVPYIFTLGTRWRTPCWWKVMAYERLGGGGSPWFIWKAVGMMIHRRNPLASWSAGGWSPMRFLFGVSGLYPCVGFLVSTVWGWVKGTLTIQPMGTVVVHIPPARLLRSWDVSSSAVALHPQPYDELLLVKPASSISSQVILGPMSVIMSWCTVNLLIKQQW